MQEMLYPTSYIKSRHLAKSALITDGRFSGGTRPEHRPHSPEVAPAVYSRYGRRH